MTEFRCEQYESVIFGTTQHYHQLRMELLKSMAAVRQEQLQVITSTIIMDSNKQSKGGSKVARCGVCQKEIS